MRRGNDGINDDYRGDDCFHSSMHLVNLDRGKKNDREREFMHPTIPGQLKLLWDRCMMSRYLADMLNRVLSTVHHVEWSAIC